MSRYLISENVDNPLHFIVNDGNVQQMVEQIIDSCCEKITLLFGVENRDITDTSPENFSGHLVFPDHEFGGIFARSVHLNNRSGSEKVRRHVVSSFSREASSNT